MSEEYLWKTFGMKPKSEWTVLGKPTPKLDGSGRVSGRIKFPSDVHLPGMLYAKILWNPHTRAKLISLDVSKAQALPGVVYVLTYKDDNPFGAGPIMLSAGRPLLPKPGDELLMWGQEVCAVVAETEDIAEDALALINAQYEVLQHVLDPEEAAKPDAPKIKAEGNAQKPIVFSRGDVNKGFAESDKVLEMVFRPNRVFNNPIEPRGCVATMEYGKVTIRPRTQGTHAGIGMISAVLGIPQNKIISKFEAHGGSYGASALATSETLYAILGSYKTGRPVRCIYGREEEMSVVHGHGDRVQYVKIGAKNDGKLRAISVKSYHNNGAFGGGSEVTPEWSEQYICENLYVESIPVFTNQSNSGAYRAVSNPHTNYAKECAMDAMANALGMNPLEFRQKNLVTVNDGDQPPRTPPRKFSSWGIQEGIDKAVALSGWKEKWHKPGEKTLPNGRKHGIGIAITNDSHGVSGTVGNTFIRLLDDETIQILSGCVDNGNGTNTWIPMIVANELGIPLSRVVGTFSDTDATPDHGASWGSTRTVGSGWGTALAAVDMRNKLADVAIKNFFKDKKREDLVFKDDKVYVKGDEANAKTFKQVADQAQREYGGPILAVGYTPPDPPSWLARYNKAPPRTTHIVEVEVDTGTGEIFITNTVNTVDVGPCMNPTTFENEAQGGTVQGIGTALSEQHIFDEATGVVLNDNWIEFKIPTIMDVSDIKAAPIEAEDHINVYGMKGFAEPSKTSAQPALVNAVINATGKQITRLPLEPKVILDALKGGA